MHETSRERRIGRDGARWLGFGAARTRAPCAIGSHVISQIGPKKQRRGEIGIVVARGKRNLGVSRPRKMKPKRRVRSSGHLGVKSPLIRILNSRPHNSCSRVSNRAAVHGWYDR